MENNHSSITNHQYRIVFFGTPIFVDPVLNVLGENFDVVKAIRSPQEWNDKAIEELKNLNPDFFVVASFGQILPNKILEIPKIAPVNIHPSLLPLYRGPSPIQTAILNGDTTTGVTFIKMDEKMDHGPIIKQVKLEINPDETFESFAKKSFKLASEMLPVVLTGHDNWELKMQDEAAVTFTKLLTKNDGYIDDSTVNEKKSMINIKNMIRAFYPWPGVWTKWSTANGKQLIVKLLPEDKVQVEGKKPMSYKDFINGYTSGKELLEKLNLL